jgi:hypothetical protein
MILNNQQDLGGIFSGSQLNLNVGYNKFNEEPTRYEEEVRGGGIFGNLREEVRVG